MKNNTKLVENSSDSSLDSGKILSRLVNFRYYDTVVQIFKYFWVSLLAAIADFPCLWCCLNGLVYGI